MFYHTIVVHWNKRKNHFRIVGAINYGDCTEMSVLGKCELINEALDVVSRNMTVGQTRIRII